MILDPGTLARARLAIRQASGQFLYDPNVSLIDLGYPEHDGQIAGNELAIRFHVRKKLAGAALEMAVEAGLTRTIPPSIGGFATDVPVGTYRPQQWSIGGWRQPVEPRASRILPLRGGISISNASVLGYGTLGGVVRDRRTGAPMVLSNWHVLARVDLPWRSQAIYQPGRLDHGSSADRIGDLDRGAIAAHLDAAVARLTGDRPWLNEQLGVGAVTGVARPQLGMEVIKSGRRTGVTEGWVTAVEGIANLRYGPVNRTIEHIVTIEPRRPFTELSAPGDSGSWWLEVDSRRAVGLHFAGSNDPERALALDLQMVLDVLEVDLATSDQPWPAARRAAGWRLG